jgi:hypothetical protein
MKLGTHQERMEALESTFELAQAPTDKAGLIQLAAKLEQDEFFAKKSRDEMLQSASSFQQGAAAGRSN